MPAQDGELSRETVRDRGVARAADGTPINTGQRVHVVATVIGAAGPLNDLSDTGVVALSLEGYDNGHSYSTPYLKVCVPPERIAHVVTPEDADEIAGKPPTGMGSSPVGETT